MPIAAPRLLVLEPDLSGGYHLCRVWDEHDEYFMFELLNITAFAIFYIL